jgi:homoserine/homoserine lactone efflux protein
MTLEAWLLFCVTLTVLCFTPGPAVILVVSQTVTRGARAGLAASLGILTANAAYFAISGTGLGALLLASREAFTVLKWMGAIYLIWLGIQLFRSGGSPPSPSNESDRDMTSGGRAYLMAVMTQGANPKALLFFTGILPQFIHPESPVAPQILLLGISAVVIEFLVLALYVAAFRAAESWMREPRVAKALRRVGGGLLIGAGVRLALIERR